MTRPLLRHFRRCRAVFALALCAWLTLASAVWARSSDCCAAMVMADSVMGMQHGVDAHHHDAGQTAADATDGCCAHASLYTPTVLALALRQAAPTSAVWRVYRQVAPQPVYEPPLRPPVA